MKTQAQYAKDDIDYVKSVLEGRVANCVPDGELDPPTGARCKTRSGFRAWLRKALKVTEDK